MSSPTQFNLLDAWHFDVCPTLQMSGATRMSWTDVIAQIKSGQGHECIYGNCLPYYDFDFELDSESEMKACQWALFEERLDEIKALFPNGAIRALDASGYSPSKDTWKVSFHFVVNNAGYFDCGHDMLRGEFVPEDFDSSVYKRLGKRQLFRLPYCSKEGETRQLKLVVKSPDGYKLQELADVPDDVLLQCIVSYTPGNGAIIEVEPEERPVYQSIDTDYSCKFEDVEPIRELCKVAGLFQHNALSEYAKWRDVVWALRHAADELKIDLRDLAQEVSKDNDNYDEYEVDKMYEHAAGIQGGNVVTLGSLRFMARQADAIAYERWCAKYAPKKQSKAIVRALDRAEISELMGLDEKDTKEPSLDELAPANDKPEKEPEYKQAGEWHYADWTYFKKNWKNVNPAELKQYLNDSIIHVINEGMDTIFTKNILPDKTVKYTSVKAPFQTVNDFIVKLNGEEKIRRMSDIFQEHYQQTTYYYLDFVPYLKCDPTHKNVFNMFQGFKHKFRAVEAKEMEEIKSRIQPILDHFKLIGGDHWELLLQWFCDIAQNPARKPTICPVIKGAQGCGKTILTEFMCRLLGESLTNTFTEIGQMTSKFNIRLVGKMLNVGNELANYAGHRVADQLKALVTDSDLQIEPKGKEAFTVRNPARTILVSNNDVPIRAERGGRRYLCVEASSDKCGDIAYFKALAKCMGEFEQDFWDYICNYDISGFDPYAPAPMTQMKRDLVMDNVSPTIQFMVAVGNGDCDFERNGVSYDFKFGENGEALFPSSLLFKGFHDWCALHIPGRSQVSAKKFCKDMQELGAQYNRFTIESFGVKKRQRAYKIDKAELEAKLRKHMGDNEFEFDG